jgi:2-polyprenyl-3-methyl-5-hydroxy-6-metoxy-1,4-benzoquinol methylase
MSKGSGHAAPNLTPAELADVYRLRYGNVRTTGPLPRLWHRLGYFTPDVFYEAMVAKLVRTDTSWLDVGCGRDIFPSNRSLARLLVNRCKTVVGIDPDGTLGENCLVHVKVKSTVEEFRTETPFDLVTLRMVAEHLEQPQLALAALARVTKPGAKVLVYTVSQWSPASLLARCVPFVFHHPLKHFLWQTKEMDTFPVVYKMNTRKSLRRHFQAHGFREIYFSRQAECCLFFQFKFLHLLELLLWRILSFLSLPYPEATLLAVFQRV